MAGLKHEQFPFASQRVVNGELAGWRHCRIEAGGGYMHGNLQQSRRHCRIEIAQRRQGPASSLLVTAHRFAAANAGQRQPQRMMAEARHVQMGAVKALVPRQGQRADAAAQS